MRARTIVQYRMPHPLRENGSTNFLEHGLPKGLAGNGSGIDTDTTDEAASLNHSGTFPEFGCLHGRSLPSWAAPDAEEIELKYSHWLFHSCCPPHCFSYRA